MTRLPLPSRKILGTTGIRVSIASTGLYAPPRVQTAAELAPQIGVDEDWILKRTRVAERRICEEPLEQMAAKAARQAIGDGPLPDLILNCSLSPTQLIPDTSVFIQQALGTSGIPSHSIHSTCLSFLTGMHHASALLHAGAYARILLVSAEHATGCRDLTHPESAALFGDGAAAAVLTRTPSGGTGELLAYRKTTLPEYAHLAQLQGAGLRNRPQGSLVNPAHYEFQMNGPAIYRRAVLSVARQLKRTLEDVGLAPDEVDWIVPHQASGPGLDTLPRFGFRKDRIVDIIGCYGNCIAASIPMALHTLVSSGRVERGDTVLVMGTGAGLSVATAVFQY